MEKRALIAVVLSLIILIVYQEWVARYYGTPPPPPSEKKEELPKPIPPQTKSPAKPAEITALPAPEAQGIEEVKVETDLYEAVFTNQGARLKSFILKRYRTSVDAKGTPLEMVSRAPGLPYPLGIQFNGPAPFNDDGILYSVKGGNLKLAGDARGTIVFQGRTSSGATLTKEFTFTGSSYAISMQVSLKGVEGAASPGLVLTAEEDLLGAAGGTASWMPLVWRKGEEPAGSARGAPFEGTIALVGNKVTRETIANIKKGTQLAGHVPWAGFDYTYFLFAVLPENGAEQKIDIKQIGPTAVRMDLSESQEPKPGEKVNYTLFIGPKDLDVLKSMGKGLDGSINFGWFGFISVPLLYVLHFFHRFTGSYGIDIILLTVLIKLLMAPLTHKSFVSMRQMQKLQPQMERLKEKFKDDREKLNKEIMELYRRNKVNPLGGCLPMLLQMPVFVGLYDALRTPIELRHAAFLWIKDLSRPDWVSMYITLGGSNVGIPVLTLLMGASMFLQQWTTPSAGDPNQRRMMLMMPAIFTVMFINFPSGLTIYWLVNNILSIGQQYWINRMQR